MDKAKTNITFFIGSFIIFLTAEIAHYIFWGMFFFYLINSLIMSLFIAYWSFFREDFSYNKEFKNYRWAMGVVMLFWFLCKCSKDRFLMESSDLSCFSWYAYYVAIVLLPLLCYEYSRKFDSSYSARLWVHLVICRVIAVILIAAILTNDFHQLAFSFPEGIESWNEYYSRGPLYFMTVIFGLIFFILALIRIFKQCTLPKSKKYILLPVLPLSVGLVYIVLYFFNLDLYINDIRFFSLADVFCYLIIVFVEACNVVYRIVTEIPNEEVFLLHRIWEEVKDRMRRAERIIDSSFSLSEEEFRINLFCAGFIQTYAKRVSNLIILGSQLGKLDFSELELSLAESVEFLKLNGVQAMLVAEKSGKYLAYDIVAVYREFEERMESILPELGAVLIVVSANRRGIKLKISAEDREGNLL